MPYLHQVVTTQLYDLQIAINDCTINEFLFTLYSAGLTALPPIKSDKITTSQLKRIVGKGIETTFGEDQPCETTVSITGDEAPKFTKHFTSYDYNANNYWAIDFPMEADIKCVPSNSTTGEYE